MIEEKDINTFIKAKRDQMAMNILMVLLLLAFATLVFLEALSIEHEHTILLATFGMVLLCAAKGQNMWVSVSRSQLIAALERIINNDAHALKILAQKKRESDSTTKST